MLSNPGPGIARGDAGAPLLLISLMKDQVAALKNAGVAAAFINSTLTPEQLRLVYRRARSGAYKLIYIAPERLGGEGFSALAREMPISLVAVDEAHCISQWGQDFRPSYLEIADFIRTLPDRPVVAAFTATATAQVTAGHHAAAGACRTTGLSGHRLRPAQPVL